MTEINVFEILKLLGWIEPLVVGRLREVMYKLIATTDTGEENKKGVQFLAKISKICLCSERTKSSRYVYLEDEVY